MKKEIFVTHQFEGFHQWLTAPESEEFLRFKHRHMFHVKLFLSVKHNDREKEFFYLKKRLLSWIERELNPRFQLVGSCEAIAEKLLEFHKEITRVEVSEDGENGAIITL